jgi:hypothetical protein
MKHEAAILRRELDRIETRRGRCVSPELKERVIAWLVARRAEGRPVSELAAELGIAAGTALRWSASIPKRAIVPVRIVSDPTPRRTVSVVSPSGFRMEGVTIAEATAVLRELG